MISLVLEGNGLDTYISRENLVVEGDEDKALHKKNLVKAKKIIVDSIMDHLIPQMSWLKTLKEMFDLRKSEDEFDKTVEECEDLECRDHTVILCKGLSNQRTTWSSRRRSGECRSCDSHLEWPPRIIGIIHARNVWQKEMITFSRI